MAENKKQRAVLGKGFDALISSDFDQSILLNADERVEKIPVELILPNPQQPRKHFDQSKLDELAASIKQYGIIQPLIVTRLDNKYIIIAGERRLMASKIAGLATVPAIIRTTKELEQLEIAIIENVQRVDLNPLEQAVSIQRLHDQFSLSYDDVAKRLGKATPTINNIVRLLQLPDKAKQALIDGKITEGHARQILSLKGDEKRQLYLLDTIIRDGWNVRKAERFVVSFKEGVTETKTARKRTDVETPLTRSLSKKLETTVQIKRMAYGGRLEITFNSDEDLDRIIKTLNI